MNKHTKGLDAETIQLIKDTVDAESLMMSLGFKIYKRSSGDLRATCVLHGGDNPTAFSMRTDSKRWKCFTHRCEIGPSGRLDNDLISLVQRVNGTNFIDSVKYLSDFCGVPFDIESGIDEEKHREFKKKRDIQKYVNMVSRLNHRDEELPEISESLIRSYISKRDDFFLEQGFRPETLELFEVGMKYDNEGIKRATIPIRDDTGKLVSISGRREDGDEEPRYKLDYQFDKSRVLYNFHRALELGLDTLILVEGFKALWAVIEAGHYNVAGCMGSIVTYEQFLLLCSSPIKKCLILFDGDKSGRAGVVTSKNLLSKAFAVEVAELPDRVSPDDYSNREELSDFIYSKLSLFN